MRLDEAIHHIQRVYRGITKEEQLEVAERYCTLILERLNGIGKLCDNDFNVLIDKIARSQEKAESLVGLIASVDKFNEAWKT